MTLLNRVFGTLGDSVLDKARGVLQEHKNCGADFPAEAINEALGKAGKSASFDHHDNIRHFLDITYNSKECFLALSLLYEEKLWGTLSFDADHIFPRSSFRGKQLLELPVSHEKRMRYSELYDRVGNLQLLSATENKGKSDQDFGIWLKTRDSSFRERHLIPNDDRLLDIEHFEEFIEAREELIRCRLSRILSV